jgi:hypothetical protein
MDSSSFWAYIKFTLKCYGTCDSYLCDALSKLIFTGELEGLWTSGEGASPHNPVSPVKINC